MTLTYWVAECQNDSSAYNIREKTKKAVIERLKSDHGCVWQPRRKVWASDEGQYSSRYGKPHKVIVEYDSALDLLKQCLSEGSIYEGEDQ